MDPLSQVINLLSPQAVGLRVLEAHGGWTLRFSPVADIVVFGQVLDGACTIDRPDGAGFDLDVGDFMLMASPPFWSMAAGDGGVPVGFKAYLADPALLLKPGSGGRITRLVAGHFVFGAPHADVVTRLMPPVIHVRRTEVAAGRIGALLTLLGDEALADRPGRALVTDRLLDLLLVEALRHHDAGLSRRTGIDATPGLLAGLADPQIGRALYLMHADAARAWTVAALAREVGMSRSSFAARFNAVVGSPPVDYLAGWRMTIAKAALADATAPMIEIAEAAGYQSVSAFSTAFRRTTGRSPTAYRAAAG